MTGVTDEAREREEAESIASRGASRQLFIIIARLAGVVRRIAPDNETGRSLFIASDTWQSPGARCQRPTLRVENAPVSEHRRAFAILPGHSTWKQLNEQHPNPRRSLTQTVGLVKVALVGGRALLEFLLGSGTIARSLSFVSFHFENLLFRVADRFSFDN